MMVNFKVKTFSFLASSFLHVTFYLTIVGLFTSRTFTMKAVTSPYVTPGWVITPGIVEWTIQIRGNLWTPIKLLFIANFKKMFILLVNRVNRMRKIKLDVRHSCERIDELIVQWCIQWNKGCLMKTYFGKLFLTKFLVNRYHLSPRFINSKTKCIESRMGKSKIGSPSKRS